MPTIALEMERLRNPYSGLGQYCLHLGHAFAADTSVAGLDFACMVPASSVGIFGGSVEYREVKPWHKWVGMEIDADVWHCMHQDSEFKPRNRNTPLIYTIHDLNFLDRPDYSVAKKNERLAKMQRTMNAAKGLVYISEYVRDWVHQFLQVPAGVAEKVIYNGGFMAPYSVDNQSVKVGITRPFLFSIGIHPKKNYHVLMPLLAAESGYDWVIAGADSRGYQAVIEKEAARWGVSDRVRFCGPVNETEKQAYYQTCEALLFPSLSEGFGLPVIEAMSFGKPVFLSNKTSLPEIGGKEAYYFQNFDPDHLQKTFQEGIQDYQNDPKKAQKISTWAAQFTWEKAAKQYKEMYFLVVSDKR